MQRSPLKVPIWRETRHEKPRRIYANRHRIARAIDNRRARRWSDDDGQGDYDYDESAPAAAPT